MRFIWAASACAPSSKTARGPSVQSEFGRPIEVPAGNRRGEKLWSGDEIYLGRACLRFEQWNGARGPSVQSEFGRPIEAPAGNRRGEKLWSGDEIYLGRAYLRTEQ